MISARMNANGRAIMLELRTGTQYAMVALVIEPDGLVQPSRLINAVKTLDAHFDTQADRGPAQEAARSGDGCGSGIVA